jgi:predicted  nucleic acid-binding Zn-ribbon protein
MKTNETDDRHATCIRCGDDYNYKRKQLGYSTCLTCGDRTANRIIARRTQQNLREMAPHSYTGSVEDLFDRRGGE